LNVPFSRSVAFLAIPGIVLATLTAVNIFARLRSSIRDSSIGIETNRSSAVACEACGRTMRILAGSGPGYLFLERGDLDRKIGPAERCRACGRVWCASCYPARPRNTCPCGRDRELVARVGGATYTGPIRLVKVKYE
jgi:hypothetical protein